MAKPKVRLPSPATLKKYGLSLPEWKAILVRQGYVCPICHRKFDEKVRPVIDHLHVRRYKHLKPEQRKRQVRGLLCIYCNRYRLPKGMNLAVAKSIVRYLGDFEDKIRFSDS